MQPLKITAGRKQRRGWMIRGAVLAVIALALATWFGDTAKMVWVGLGLGLVLAGFFLYYCGALATAYTECTPEHIRTRRLGPARVTPWSQVRDIAQYTNDTGRGTGYYVQVTTTADKKYWLGAITTTTSGGKDGDPEFAGQLEQVVDYWHAADPAQHALG
jgi:hypothetical protein